MKNRSLVLILFCGLSFLHACNSGGTPQSTATHFSVTAMGNAIAGSAFKIIVTALDASNNTVTTYSGTVRFTSSDAQAVLPASSALNGGIGTFSVTLMTPGAQTVTATDTVVASITGTSNSVAVTVPATHFRVSVPANASAGTSFLFSATALDASNNAVFNYSGAVHFTSTDPQASLPADSTLTSGSGSFPVTLKTLGSQTITATDTTTASITGNSSSITVVSNAATHFSVSFRAPTWSPGNPLSFTVNALDAINNASTTYTGTIHVTSTDAMASLPANSTLTNGTGSFLATLNTVGNQTISATDTVTASVTGTSSAINIAKLTIMSGNPPNGTVGVGYAATPGNCTSQPGFLLLASGGFRSRGGYKFFSTSLPPGLAVGQFAQVGGPGCPSGGPAQWILFGTPTQAGTFSNVVISVTDAEPITANTTYAITIGAAPAAKSSAKGTIESPVQHHHYKLTDLGSFGGPGGGIVNPSSRVLNNHGEVIGAGDTSVTDPFAPNYCFYDCFVNQAFSANNGVVTLLNPPPSDAGLSSIPGGINSKGQVVGQTQTGDADPATGWPESRGVFWQAGRAIELPTLGGTQAIANSINDSGYVVGAALTATPDPFASSPLTGCVFLPTTYFSLCLNGTFATNATFFPGTTETHAFLWHQGSLEDLGTLGGPDSSAWIINERGEVAGWSFTSFFANPSNGVPNMDPFLWSPVTRKMKDLGTLGGSYGAAFWLNNRGQVVGTSNLAGDNGNDPFLWDGETMKDLGTFGGNFGAAYSVNDDGEVVGTASIPDGFIFAFSWKNGVMKNLGTVDGDECSQAFSINADGQIVGVSDSCTTGADLHGFLVERDQPMVDLNTLLVPATTDTVVSAVFIDDRGEIGCLVQVAGGSTHACVLTPCDEVHPHLEGCDYDPVDSATAAAVRAPQSPGISQPVSAAGGLARMRSMTARYNRQEIAPPK